MAQATSAVTPERYERAMSYPVFLASIEVNRDQFQRYDDRRRYRLMTWRARKQPFVSEDPSARASWAFRGVHA